MEVYFVDMSALSKRYVAETGSTWLSAQLDPATGNLVYVAQITSVELISALTRRGRGGSLTVTTAAAARTAFRGHLAAEYLAIEITDTLVKRAMLLAETYGLRSYDAVQLAVALDVNARYKAAGLPAFTLLSSDAELNMSAIAEGLTVEDPNTHP